MGEQLMDVLRQAPVLDVFSWLVQKKQVVLAFKDADKYKVGRLFQGAPDQVLVVDLDLALFAMAGHAWQERVCPRLAAPGRVCVDFFRVGLHDLAIDAEGDGYSSTVYFDRFPRVDQFGNAHRGGVWWGTENRRDGRGVEWSRRFTDLVTDDFGTLVDSSTGEAP